MKEGELFICKIKEIGLDFFAPLVRAMQEHLDENWPGYTGQIRNAPDGTYELFATKKEKPDETIQS